MATLLILVFGAAVFLAGWFLAPFAFRKRAERFLAAGCARRKVLVLSYDDGPGNELTPRLLDLLKSHNAHASFYVLGKHAEGKRDIIKHMVAQGHHVGSHTQRHTNAWKAMPWTAARDFDEGARTVLECGGKGHDFRPPFGKLTLAGLVQGRIRGVSYGWWTVDSRDSWARRPVADVLAELEGASGGVLLMHDFDTYEKAPRQPSHIDYVLALTDEALKLAHRKGWQVVTYAELEKAQVSA